ncbi:MAG: hypothetical protein JSR18_05185, partial [Proteobacteria bacterium]|nr:hypothetical protein [Pseudomonadota bacterium]
VALPFASEVVTRWIGDKRYLDARGRPRVLARSAPGEEPSFDALVAGISTDVRPRVLLDELRRLGVVTVHADQSVELMMGAFVPQKDRRQRLFFLGRNLHDHIAACVHNLADRAPSMMEQSVFSFELSPAATAEIANEVRRAWQDVLATLIPAIAAREEADRASGNATERINIGMYCYHESADSPASHGPASRNRRSRSRGAPTPARGTARSKR